MKTHRIILPREQHAAALAGVDRLLLPMREQPRTDEVPGVVWFHVGDRAYGGKRVFAEDGCPYKPGDRLALLEPWMRRLPLTCCTCFYRVLDAEPVRVTDISEEHARECGFEDEKVNEFPPVRSAKSPLYEAWLALGRSGADWVWSVAVERWVNAEH